MRDQESERMRERESERMRERESERARERERESEREIYLELLNKRVVQGPPSHGLNGNR